MQPNYGGYATPTQHMQPHYPQQVPPPAQQPPAPPSSLPPGGDPFSDPTGGAAGPAIRELDGRTVIMQPTGIDPNAVHKGKSRPNATYNLTVVDGGPLMYGSSEDEEKPRPFTNRIDTPCHFRGIQTGNSEIYKALATEYNKGPSPQTGQMGLIVGRIFRGTKGMKPWLIERLDTTDPRRHAAIAVYGAMQGGTFVNPEPIDLMPGTGVPAYGQSAQQHYAQPAPPSPYAAMAGGMAQQPQQQYAQPPTPPQYGGVPQGAQPGAAQAIPPAPPNFDPGMWANLAPAAREAILAEYARQQQSQTQVQPTY